MVGARDAAGTGARSGERGSGSRRRPKNAGRTRSDLRVLHTANSVQGEEMRLPRSPCAAAMPRVRPQFFSAESERSWVRSDSSPLERRSWIRAWRDLLNGDAQHEVSDHYNFSVRGMQRPRRRQGGASRDGAGAGRAPPPSAAAHGPPRRPRVPHMRVQYRISGGRAPPARGRWRLRPMRLNEPPRFATFRYVSVAWIVMSIV
jgi:hypothetical protein